MPFDIKALARPAILSMQAYQSARSHTHAGSDLVYMDANELGESTTPELSRYPEPQPRELVEDLTARFGVTPAHLFLGAGVDDAIDALVRVFCEARRDSILITPPTYGYYAVAAAIQGAEVLAAPLSPETFDVSEAKILATLRPSTKLVFLCNPNNPTGNSYQQTRLLQLAKALEGRAILVVDEAYIEFSAERSLVAEAQRVPNLVVLRTLSKAWGLAGVRLGAAVADPEIIVLMHKVRAPYPISRPAAAAGAKELARLSTDVLQVRLSRVIDERDALAAGLAKLGSVLRVFPSDANFLLIKTKDAKRFMQICSAAGFVVRDRSHEWLLQDCVRISVGSAAENLALLEALAKGGA